MNPLQLNMNILNINNENNRSRNATATNTRNNARTQQEVDLAVRTAIDAALSFAARNPNANNIRITFHTDTTRIIEVTRNRINPNIQYDDKGKKEFIESLQKWTPKGKDSLPHFIKNYRSDSRFRFVEINKIFKDLETQQNNTHLDQNDLKEIVYKIFDAFGDHSPSKFSDEFFTYILPDYLTGGNELFKFLLNCLITLKYHELKDRAPEEITSTEMFNHGMKIFLHELLYEYFLDDTDHLIMFNILIEKWGLDIDLNYENSHGKAPLDAMQIEEILDRTEKEFAVRMITRSVFKKYVLSNQKYLDLIRFPGSAAVVLKLRLKIAQELLKEHKAKLNSLWYIKHFFMERH